MEHIGIMSKNYAKRIRTYLCLMTHISLYSLFFIPLVSCSHPTQETVIIEDHLVAYPGRTFNYKMKFNDLQSKQHDVASRIGLPHPPKNRIDAASMQIAIISSIV